MELTKNKVLEKIRTQKPEYKNFSDEVLLEAAIKQFPDLKIKEDPSYLEELWWKVLEWVDNAFTDVADLTVWNAVRGFGWDYEAKPLRHLLWSKDESDYKWGLIKNMANSIGSAGELVWQSIETIANNSTNPLTVWKEILNMWWNIVWWVTNTLIWQPLISWIDTLVQDETQESIKQYIAEESQKNNVTWNIIRWLWKLSSEMERIKVEDPERYRQLQASFGWIDVIWIWKWKQALSMVDDITKKYWKKWIEVLKNKVDDGLKVIDNLKNKSDDVIENIWENIDNIKPKESFFTKIEEKIAWIDEQTKNILKKTSEEDFDKYLSYAKNAVEDIKNPTPLEIAWDEAGDVLKTLWNMKNNAWKLKSEALKNVENIEIDTKPIFDDFVDFLEKSNLTIDWEWRIKNISWKVASVWDDSIKDIQNLSDEMMEIFTREKIDLWSLDSLVDRIQDWINFKALNRPWSTPSKTEKQISWFLWKSLNDRLKVEAWEDFVKYNEEFRKFLNLETKLSRLLWEDWNKGWSLMKAVFSPTDRWVKKLFSEIQKETWVDLISRAWLAKFAMQAVWDARQASLLEALDLWPWFTWKLKNNLLKIPIVWNFMDLAEDWAKKIFSPERIWKKIVYKARTNLDEAKHYTNVDSSIYKNISEIEVENTIKKYFWDEVWVEFLEKIKTPEWLDALWRYKDKLISFAKNPKENVVEHEALHAYFDLALKESEKTNILSKIKTEKNFKDLLDAEEFLADSFADFVIWRRNVSWISENLKKIIWDLAFKFKQFFWKEDKVEALFRDLESIWNWKKKFEIKADWNSAENKFLLAWEKAEKSPKSILEKAKDMEAEWKTPDEIWKATWWEKWKDWKWRWEINDSKAKIIQKDIWEYKLSEILNHKELFKNYPELKDFKVKVLSDIDAWWASAVWYFDKVKKEIWISKNNLNTEEWKSSILHEIQHFIQNKEWFVNGWNPAGIELYKLRELHKDKLKSLMDNHRALQRMRYNTPDDELKDYMFLDDFKWSLNDYKKKLDIEIEQSGKKIADFEAHIDSREWRIDTYRRKWWEVEARNIEKRLKLSTQERKSLRPEKTEDITRDRQWWKNEDNESVRFLKKDDVKQEKVFYDWKLKISNNGKKIKMSSDFDRIPDEAMLELNKSLWNKKSTKLEINLLSQDTKKLLLSEWIDISKIKWHLISSDWIKHTYKEHWINAKMWKKEVPVTEEDIKLIPKIIKEPDSVKLSSNLNNRWQIVIKYAKKMWNKYYYLEYVDLKDWWLWNQTMYINK